MRRIIFCGSFAAQLLAAQFVFASADSIGPNGINSSGLSLTGSGVGIGQVETGRPGDSNFDTAPTPFDFTHNAINPTQVFIRYPDNVTFTATANAANETTPHALEMAGVLISTETTTKGVSPAANLYSAGIAPTGPTAEDVYAQAAITANKIATLATQDIWAINMSFAVTANGLDADGTSTLSSFVDWSARVHDVLYAVAGNETGVPGPLPADNFNGMTVVYSKKNGSKYRQVDPENIFTADDFWIGNGDFTHPDIMAPGRNLQFATQGSMTTTVPDMFRNGTSPATPHVTGTAALLQQHAATQIGAVGGPRWTANARHHEVMKAVIMNSADKIEEGSIATRNGLAIPAGGLLGMERTAIDTNGDDWFDSEADDDTEDTNATRRGGFIPLDDQMGVGHLNANRALKQFSTGEFNDSTTVDVPVMGWDYSFTSGAGDNNNRYRFNEPLKGGSFISITLAWDRVVNFDTNAGGAGYDVGDTFVDYKDTDAPGDLPSDSQINDLDLYFQDRGALNIFSALASSSSRQGNLEHLFFQVPADGNYEFWVVQHDADIGGIQNYGVAWWGLSSSLVSQGDFDGSGTVDAADLAQWKGDFGIDNGSDADGDGDSDGADFLAWQRGLGTNSATLTAAAVPEPAAWMLCAVGLPLLRRRRTA